MCERTRVIDVNARREGGEYLISRKGEEGEENATRRAGVFNDEGKNKKKEGRKREKRRKSSAYRARYRGFIRGAGTRVNDARIQDAGHHGPRDFHSKDHGRYIKKKASRVGMMICMRDVNEIPRPRVSFAFENITRRAPARRGLIKRRCSVSGAQTAKNE